MVLEMPGFCGLPEWKPTASSTMPLGCRPKGAWLVLESLYSDVSRFGVFISGFAVSTGNAPPKLPMKGSRPISAAMSLAPSLAYWLWSVDSMRSPPSLCRLTK